MKKGGASKPAQVAEPCKGKERRSRVGYYVS